MATGSMVPYSNTAGNNQTTPGAGLQPKPVALPQISPLNPTGTVSSNPLVPTTATPVTQPGVPAGAAGGVFNAGSTSTNSQLSDKQLTDIYGKGIGGDLNNLLNSIGGTNSATLQEYEQSLVPQEATAQANLDASLGAGGVSANSSVAAIGNANLQSQETAAIAGETAQLTQSGQQLEANILTGTEQAAEQEVAQSGWDVFGEVMQGLGNLGGEVVGAAGKVGGFGELF
jgi:hypothetical protein